MTLTLGPVIGTVGDATWDELPFEELNVNRTQERTLMTAAPPPPRIWRLRSSSSWTTSLAVPAQAVCWSVLDRCPWLRGRTLSGMCSRQRRRSRSRPETASVLRTRPSPGRSSRCRSRADLSAGAV